MVSFKRSSLSVVVKDPPPDPGKTPDFHGLGCEWVGVCAWGYKKKPLAFLGGEFFQRFFFEIFHL